MTGASTLDIGPELRKLAQKILDQIDFAIRLAASRAAGEGAPAPASASRCGARCVRWPRWSTVSNIRC